MIFHFVVFAGGGTRNNVLCHFDVDAPDPTLAQELLYHALEDTRYGAISPSEFPAGVTLRYISFVTEKREDIDWSGTETDGPEPLGPAPRVWYESGTETRYIGPALSLFSRLQDHNLKTLGTDAYGLTIVADPEGGEPWHVRGELLEAREA
jgi:hypothetical protein